jgi:hypothetical protein
MKKIMLKLSCVLVILYGSFAYTFAQTSAFINLEPENPEPQSVVTLTVGSYSFNVNTARITWKSRGKIILEGQGERKLKIRTGEVGESSVVTVTIATVDGTSVEQTITISPSSIALLYEAPKSYVPLFYEGRSLPADGAEVRVTAFPSMSEGGRILTSSSLSYSWYVNDSLLSSVSGINKQTARINLDYLANKTDIRVLVHSPLGNSAEKTITIYPHEVMPLLYEYDPILGTNFMKNLAGRYETTKDFVLSLEPFYASNEYNDPMSSIWYLDGLPSTPLDGRILALRPKENDYGSKLLSIDVFGSDKILQKATAKLELIFDTRK